MFGLILLSLAVVGGLGGWFLGDRKRGWRLTILWVLLPFWLCLLTVPAAIFGGIRDLLEWLIILSLLIFPMMAWVIPAAIGFTVARPGNEAKAPS